MVEGLDVLSAVKRCVGHEISEAVGLLQLRQVPLDHVRRRRPRPAPDASRGAGNLVVGRERCTTLRAATLRCGTTPPDDLVGLGLLISMCAGLPLDVSNNMRSAGVERVH